MTVKAFKISSLFEVRFIDRASGCERPHTHSSLIISAVTQGNISLQITATEICLKKGMIAVVGPNVSHCVRSYSPQFAGVYILEIFGLPINVEGLDEFPFQIFGSRLFQENKIYDVFVNLCEVLLSQISDDEKIKSCVNWLSNFCDSYFSDYPLQIPERRESDSDQLAVKIKSILDECNEEAPSYAEIAKTCGCSKEHCNRIFKRTYNLSMQAYFLNKKAAKAKDMLDSGENLSDVALMCGFYDQSHFTRVFKDIYQVSPQKYRKAVSRACHSHTRKSRPKNT